MKTAIAIVIAVLIIAGGAVLLVKNKKSPSTSTNTTSSTQSAPSSSTNNQPSSDQSNPNGNVVATITYSDSGFSPTSITVKAGSKVEIKNTSSHAIQLNSDPHPVHTDDTDLNVGTVEAGQSTTFTVQKIGTFGYHNHLNPSEKGSITVQ